MNSDGVLPELIFSDVVSGYIETSDPRYLFLVRLNNVSQCSISSCPHVRACHLGQVPSTTRTFVGLNI